ncbi:M20/M25/M40 family metallo-hydrolase [Candidatus Kryptobacter tengchongensis]|uniref:Acetylornithine deacetylase/Succinyl-diaminopimelate desuccinylase n=1 Tax=Kryptobacter tengchongensis TaxID=1643429 RepID=A0A656D9S4_KRYT1|nr:M20/M25/M40 family metallo-hydrolase [Candidatus Kryptobacter tengchongensis]CUT04282.1 Acetylornithine deacetylase/Succinyl-diaminopimelate desuccinylase [Candidatus Kryptobacter tengchongensis]
MAGQLPNWENIAEKINSYVDDVRNEFEQMLGEIVEIPTVSMDPSYKNDIERGADLAVEFLKKFGFEAKKCTTPGNPVVFGSYVTDPKNPTVAIYNHLDVQPAGGPEWIREPFKFTKENGKYYGRGTTDDKGPALTALFAARFAVENGIPINIKFIWEFEEENGSPNFGYFIKNYKSELKTNSVLVSDTLWISSDKPAIPYGLRGLQGARLVLETGTKDVHSGTTGGWARNPIGELCQLISQLYDAKTGKVKIPGFYKDVKKLSDKELKNFLSSGFDVKKRMEVFGFKSVRTKDKAEVLRRIWAEPTFEVHGIVGGYTGPGIKTIVPPRAEAKISMRLVPNQTPKKAFKLLKDYVKKLNPDVEVKPENELEPYLGEFEGPYASAAVKAIEYAFGVKPAFIREGGSIGAVVTMQKLLKVPIVMIGLSLPEHGYHEPNENFDWKQASGGMKAFVRYFYEISQIK